MITLKKALIAILAAAIVYGVYYAAIRFPFIAGYGAKDLCSCVFVGERSQQDVLDHELSFFPVSLGSFSVDFRDSSATGSVLGMSSHKAIYRKGFGCTLVSEISESEIRAQKMHRPLTSAAGQDTLPWPSGDRLSRALPANIRITELNQILDSAFSEPGDKKRRNLRAAVVVYEGQIIAERYAPGFTMKSRHHGWSMTKSVTNAIVGLLSGEHRLDIHAAAPVPEWKNDARNTITIEELLQATSGLKWWENYGNPSEATTMLFKKKDMGSYAASAEAAFEPGTHFSYSSGTPNLLSRIVRETLGDDEYYAYPYRKLFHKIGMNSAVIEPDAGGSFVASSYSFATARDWARFGLLYLNDGVWNGERILPEGWVTFTATPSQAAPAGEYGALFWLNAGAKGNTSKRRYPGAPTDVFGCDGYEGQNIWIVPSKKLVIVRLSQETGNFLNEDRFLSSVIATVP